MVPSITHNLVKLGQKEAHQHLSFTNTMVTRHLERERTKIDQPLAGTEDFSPTAWPFPLLFQGSN